MTYFSKLVPEEKIPRVVGFLGFDGLTTLDLTGPLEAFAAARTDDGAPGYQTLLIGVTKKSFIAGSGAMFMAQHTLATAPALDTILIPGGASLRESEVGKTISHWLQDRAGTTRRIASVSTGIYPLAQSGLLDGRRVTTHWRFAQNLACTFRALEVHDTGSFIQDEKFYTCGGGTAGIEMSLALIEEDCGLKAALRLARELVVNLRPSSGDERQLDPGAEQTTPEERLAELPAWISSRLHQDLSVEVLAARACLCPRHFGRLFKRSFQITPAGFVEQLRINEAARRLAVRRLSVEGVAAAVGFRSAEVFRRAFERRFGITPSRFQKDCRRSSQNLQTNSGIAQPTAVRN